MYVCIYDAISVLASHNVSDYCCSYVIGTILYLIKDLAKGMKCDWEFAHMLTLTKQTLTSRLICKAENSLQSF